MTIVFVSVVSFWRCWGHYSDRFWGLSKSETGWFPFNLPLHGGDFENGTMGSFDGFNPEVTGRVDPPPHALEDVGALAEPLGAEHLGASGNSWGRKMRSFAS